MSTLTNIARMLRRRSTKAETMLWEKVRNRQLDGVKFRRQQPIGPYVVDFVNFERKVVVELDGGQHALNSEADKSRDAWLGAEGFTVLRFWNNEVIENLDGVLGAIQDTLKSPSPNPSHKGRGINGQQDAR
ncbi:MAG: endonuclease domain-containing protein [Candidatus Hydrogenedentes bacterium]|nr:endonuclease domain-containing protein [Candidatus Hydrogenedentota bacterium]